MDQNSFREDAPEQVVRAAWLYYVGGYRQEQTAALMGVSRAKVHKILADARDSGIVRISIQHRFTRIVQVEESLRRRYGLNFCRVTPPLATEAVKKASTLTQAQLTEQGAIARRGVGIVAAELLSNKLQADARAVIGLGWGRTVAQIPAHLVGLSKPKAKFVSVMGSLTRTSATNPLEVASLFAQVTAGEGHFLPVPFIADTTADRQVLMSQSIFQGTLALAEKATFYLLSFGQCDENSLLFKQRHLSSAELRSLKRAGAVCDFMGKFFDADGKIISNDVNERTLAVDLKHLHKREVVLLSGGQEKLSGVRSLLKTGLVNGLIIDGDTAFQLDQEREDGRQTARNAEPSGR